MNDRPSDTFEQVLKSQTNLVNEGHVHRRPNHFQISQIPKEDGGILNLTHAKANEVMVHSKIIDIIFNFTNLKSTNIFIHNANLISIVISVRYGHYGRECPTKTFNVRESHARFPEMK